MSQSPTASDASTLAVRRVLRGVAWSAVGLATGIAALLIALPSPTGGFLALATGLVSLVSGVPVVVMALSRAREERPPPR